MTAEQKAFIEMIGKAAVKHYPTYQILPSLAIAQAILESNWNKSGLSKTCNNFFGMKWVRGCGCDYKEYQTKEQKKDGTYYTVVARFRKYPTVEEGIKGYFDFLQYKRYQNLRGVVDPEVACDLIRKDGWATSLKYSENLKRLVKEYNLTLYDDMALGKRTFLFEKGTYVVLASALKVRSGPGTEYNQKAFDEMTEYAKKLHTEFAGRGLAFYKKGIRFAATEIIKISEYEYWGKTASGYVAIMHGGNVYAEPVE